MLRQLVAEQQQGALTLWSLLTSNHKKAHCCSSANILVTAPNSF